MKKFKKFFYAFFILLSAYAALASVPAIAENASEMAIGTWAGTGAKPGDGNRWIELGGILWRVLEVYEYDESGNADRDNSIEPNSTQPPVANGDKIAFLLAEKPLDFIEFDYLPPFSSNWNNSTIKAWLNADEGFLKQKLGGVAGAIVTSNYKLGGGYCTYDYFDPDTDDSTTFNSETGAESKIFLLSYQEVNNTGYFSGEADRDMGYDYWLRSPGEFDNYAAAVLSGGVVIDYGSNVSGELLSIRPAFKINLSSSIFTSSNYQTLYSFTVGVENAADNSPISGAAVGATGKFFTNSQGVAELRLPVGSYKLTVTAPGFTAAETTITVPSAPALVPPAVTLTADAGRPDRVYFGGWLWRVLDTDDDTAFFLSDVSVAVRPFDSASGNWKESDIKAWLNAETEGNFLYSFTTGERKAITETRNYPLRGIYNHTVNETTYGLGTTDSSKVFLLSVDEALTYLPDNAARNIGGPYWLRSPGDFDYDATSVWSGGEIIVYYDVDDPLAVRPAFNLDLSSVLFTSAASAGGKNSAGLFPISTIQGSPGTPAKLTLLDDNVAPPTVVFDEIDKTKLKLDYSGAPSAEAGWTHISCLLEKDSEVKYYGKLAALDNTGAGTVDNVSLSGVSNGTYTLKIFFEQVNADKVTDYAGKPAVVTLTVNGDEEFTSMQRPSVPGAKEPRSRPRL